MNKNTISKWFSMFLLMMVAGITGATAQSLTVADFSLEQGQMTEVNIKLAAPADQTIYGVQTDITLSEGLILEEVAAVNAELQFDKNIVAGGATRVALLSLAGSSIPAGDVIKLHVKAADTFAGGTIALTNSKLTISAAGAETNVESSTANVTKTSAPQPVPVTATFNFADPNFREKVGTSLTDVNGIVYNETFTADGATLQVTSGSAASKLYDDTNRGQNLVTYPQYATLTFKAPEGKAIVQIDFTAAGNSNINKLTPSSGAIEGMVWTGNAEGVRFTQGATSYLANAVLTLVDKTDETAALPAIEYTECANIAAFNALAAGTYAKITLTDAEVIGKSADGYSTVWMQDATGGCWIQYTSLNDKLTEKTKVNGTIYTIKRETSGNPQMKEAEATLQSELNATAIESYTAIVGTIAEVNVAANLNKVVKIAADSLVMTSASAQAQAGTLYVGETSITVNNGTATANQLLCKIADWEKDKVLRNITIEAILVAKSTTDNQLLPISIVETTTPEPPVVPTITATLEHTATSYCEGDADVYTSNVDAETEHVNNNKFNSTWQGAAYAEFSFAELPANATITEAILTFKGIGESRNARNTDVMLVNAGETLDYTALAAGNAKVNLAAANIQSVSFPKASSQVFTINATEQLNALVAGGQRYAIFKFTNNPGGGDIAGKASEDDAPTLVITYALGAPAIANASFEADGEKAASNSPLELTGWTFAGVGTQFNNTELRGANSESTTSQFGTSAPNDGDYALFFRQGWNGNGNVITITSDSLTEIPSGDYLLSVAYKQHYSYDNTTSENTFVGLSLVNGETTIATGNSPAATGVNGGSADATYFNDTEWSTLEVPFSLNEAVAAGAQIVITLNAGGQRRSDFFIDNVKLEKIPGIEVALKELEKAIAAAQEKAGSYTIGEGLFTYAASEIEPLNTAITTAQTAYRTAESKAAVEAATDSLNAFVGRFAPVATTPDANKTYTFQLRLGGETPLYMALAESGITIAEEATPLKFIAVEGADGQYNLANEDNTLFVGLQGGDAWTMSAQADKKAAWTFTALPDGAYRINNLVTAGRFVGTNAADKEAGKPCYADKKTDNGNVDWLIAEYVAPTELAQTLNVERYPGMGYGVTEAAVDFTEAKQFLGVEAITTDMLRIVNPNDSLISDYAPYDGWFNGEGAAETWGTNTKVCVKFFQAIPEGKFEICDMNGADSIGATYTVKWALVANDKQVTYTINVKFVEKPVIDLKFADLSVKETKTVALTSELGKCYEGLTADVDVAAILTKLGVTSLNDVTIYAVQTDGTLDDNYKLGTTDGWRDSTGNWQTWGDNAYFFVKADFTKESAQIYEAGGMDGKNTTAQWQSPATYTATYAFVKTGTADAVVLKVTLTYTVPTGINAIARDGQKSVIYNINGQKVNKAQKGLFIINGKKTVVR